MSSLILKTFGGIAPGLAPKLLPEDMAQTAQNCRLSSGRIEPLWGTTVQQVLTDPVHHKFFHLWRHPWSSWPPNTNQSEWIEFDDYTPSGSVIIYWDADWVKSPIIDDQYSRIYRSLTATYTFDGEPYYYDTNYGFVCHAWYNGASVVYAPVAIIPRVFTAKLGCTAPSSPEKYFRYAVTLVNQFGDESSYQRCNTEIACDEGDPVILTFLAWDAGPAGNEIPTYRRIYRTASGTSQDAYFFLAETSVNTLTYVDTKTDAELAEEMPAWDFSADQFFGGGLVSMPGGFMARFNAKNIGFSEPYLPHIWYARYQIAVDFDIVGQAVSEGELVVLTRGTPYRIHGSHPELMRVQQVDYPQACVSKRSIVSCPYGVVYASPDGLVLLSGGTGRLLTQGLYSREAWQAINPSTMYSGIKDNRYIGFTSNATIIYDFTEKAGRITTSDQTQDGLMLQSDLETDSLYLIQNGNIVSWDSNSASPLTQTWRSKEFPSTRRMNWNCARIVANTYPVTFRMYADNALVETITVSSESSFRLPHMECEKTWSVEVSGTSNIDEIRMATSMSDLRI